MYNQAEIKILRRIYFYNMTYTSNTSFSMPTHSYVCFSQNKYSLFIFYIAVYIKGTYQVVSLI